MLINPISYNSFSNNKYSPVRKINNLKNNSISKNNISFNANVRQTAPIDYTNRALSSYFRKILRGETVNPEHKKYMDLMVNTDEIIANLSMKSVPEKIKFPTLKKFSSELFQGIYKIAAEPLGVTFYAANYDNVNKNLMRKIFVPCGNDSNHMNPLSDGIVVMEYEYIPEINDFYVKNETTYCYDESKVVVKGDLQYVFDAAGNPDYGLNILSDNNARRYTHYNKEGEKCFDQYCDSNYDNLKIIDSYGEWYYKDNEPEAFCLVDDKNNVVDRNGLNIFNLN